MSRYVCDSKKLPALLALGRLSMENTSRTPAHIFSLPRGGLLEKILNGLRFTLPFSTRAECLCFVQQQLYDVLRSSDSVVAARKRSTPATADSGPDSERKQKPRLEVDCT